MIRNSIWPLMVIFLIFTGCATVPVYTSNPTTQKVENDLFEVELEPHLAPGKHYFDSFRYVIVNRSDKDLVLDWEKTFYLKNGKRFGHWGWKGMALEQLQEVVKQPLITIEPGDTISELIFPLKMIARSNYTAIMRDEPNVDLGIIPESESGMLLTVRQGGKVIRETLTCTISISHMRK